MRFLAAHQPEHRQWLEAIHAFEAGVRYPLGDDWFQIDHGEDYLAFFRRLGQPHYLVAADGPTLAGMACGTLRQLNGEPVWYLGDLKVSPNYQHTRLPAQLMREGARQWAAISDTAYAISMNRPDGSNPVVRILERLPGYPLQAIGALNVYQVNTNTLPTVMMAFANNDTPITGALSLRGVKDIVLQSTGQPMPLYHLQYGPCATQGEVTLQAEAVYMACAWADSDLAMALQEQQVTVSATATVVARGLTPADLSGILTSDI